MTTADQVKQAMDQPPAGPTDIFAVAYLQLCQVSYLDPSLISAKVAKLPPLDPTRLVAVRLGAGPEL